MFDAFANFNTMPTAPQVDFTYAHPGQTRFRRSLIRAVEALTGQPKLRRLYLDWAWGDSLPGVPAFSAALWQLRITPHVAAGADHLQVAPRQACRLVASSTAARGGWVVSRPFESSLGRRP